MRVKDVTAATSETIISSREVAAYRNDQAKMLFLAQMFGQLELMRINVALLDARRGCEFNGNCGPPITPSELVREMNMQDVDAVLIKDKEFSNIQAQAIKLKPEFDAVMDEKNVKKMEDHIRELKRLSRIRQQQPR